MTHYGTYHAKLCCRGDTKLYYRKAYGKYRGGGEAKIHEIRETCGRIQEGTHMLSREFRVVSGKE